MIFQKMQSKLAFGTDFSYATNQWMWRKYSYKFVCMSQRRYPRDNFEMKKNNVVGICSLTFITGYRSDILCDRTAWPLMVLEVAQRSEYTVSEFPLSCQSQELGEFDCHPEGPWTRWDNHSVWFLLKVLLAPSNFYFPVHIKNTVSMKVLH